jgi:Flp pilus assembly protein TadG
MIIILKLLGGTDMSKLIRNEKGQAALELAIILPVILLIIMFIIYIGIFAFSKSVVLIAAHEGGREGLQIWNVSDISQNEKEQRMRDGIMRTLAALPGGDNSDTNVTDDLNGKITIQVTYHFSLNLPFLREITGYNDVPVRLEVSYRYIRE